MSTKNKEKAKFSFEERIKKLKLKIREFWTQHEVKAVMATGLVLISIISFETGVLKGQNWQQEPLIIEKPAENSILKTADLQNSNVELSNLNSENSNTSVAGVSDIAPKECALVGSKNSNKYHLPNCSYAKRIKPENIVCFSNEEDAKNKGYAPASCCVGKK